MRLARIGSWVGVLGAAAVAACPSVAFGGGFEVPMQSARAAGQSDAFTAQADDPSAVFYNPAGLTQLDGTQLTFGAYALFPQWQFESDAGPDQSMYGDAILPHAYVSTDLGTDRFRLGFGVNNPWGLSEDWGDTGPLRTVIDDARLAVINFSPAAAVKLNEQLSLGLAVNVYYADASLDRQVVLGAPPMPEGTFRLEGTDWDLGATPSLLWRINRRHAIGAYYRTAVTLEIEDTARLDIPGAPSVGPSNASLPIDIPQQIGAGYAFRPIDRLTLEADVIWTDWDTLDRLVIQSDNPAFNGQQIPADWESGFTYRFGGQFALTETWTLRGGYAYSENAVPNGTFTPIVPDSDYHLWSVGVGYGRERWAVDLAYQFIYREERDIANSALSPLVDGTWTNTMHGVMLSATLRF